MSWARPKGELPLVNDIAGFQPFENDLLVRSELLIEKQREHIKDLKERLREADRTRQMEAARTATESRILKEASAKLRLEIDLLRGELAVRAEAISLGQTTADQWKREVAELTRKLSEAEVKVKESEISKGSVERLQQKYQELQHKLTRTAPSGGGGEADLKSQERLQSLQTQILDAETLLKTLRNKIDETKIAIACMADSEFDLIESREIIKDQKNKLACLQRLVDAAVKEKQMIPPTLMVDARALVDLRTKSLNLNGFQDSADAGEEGLRKEIVNLQSMVLALQGKVAADNDTSSVTMHLITVFKDLQQSINEKLVSANKGTAAAGGDFVSLDVSHIKMMVDASNIPSAGWKLMQFAQEYMERARRSGDAVMHPRVVTIGTKFFTIAEDASGKLILYKYHQWDCKAVWDELEGWIVLRCLPAGDESAAECHILSFIGADQYLRGFHALQYAGVIPTGQTPTEYKDLMLSENAFTAVLTDAITITDGASNVADLTFAVHGDELTIEKKDGTVLTRLTPSDCYIQCDSQNQCIKLWAPECSVRQIFGAAPNENASELTQFNCIFNNPLKGYSRYLATLSELRWRDVILSSELRPKIIEKLIPRPLSGGRPDVPAPKPVVDKPSEAAKAAEQTTQKTPPQEKKDIIPSQSPAKVFSDSSTDSSQASLENFQDTMANLDSDDYEQLLIDAGLVKIMADSTHVMSQLSAAEYIVRFDDALAEIELVKKDSATGAIVDQYTFGFPDKTMYEAKRSALLVNGFKEDDGPRRNSVLGGKDDPNIAIVEPRRLRLRGVVIDAAQTEVFMNAKRREIKLIEHLPTGKARNVKLDCSTSNYKNWVRALTWAQFKIDGREAPPRPQTKLRQFRFVIFSRDHKDTASRLIRFTPEGELAIYADIGDAEPKYVLSKINSEIVSNLESRQLRCTVNPRTPQEAWLEVTFPVIKDLDEICAQLKEAGLMKGPQVRGPLGEFVDQKCPVIGMRRGIFQYWASVTDYNADKRPLVTLTGNLMEANASGQQITIVPRHTVGRSLVDYRRQVADFSVKLITSPQEFLALRFGLINSEIWRLQDRDTTDRTYQPHAAITLMFHGSATYQYGKKSESFDGKVDMALFNKVSDACTRARQLMLDRKAIKSKALVKEIKTELEGSSVPVDMRKEREKTDAAEGGKARLSQKTPAPPRLPIEMSKAAAPPVIASKVTSVVTTHTKALETVSSSQTGKPAKAPKPTKGFTSKTSVKKVKGFVSLVKKKAMGRPSAT